MSKWDNSKELDLNIKKSDVLLAMVVCSLFLKNVPMDFREKVLLFLIISKYIDIYLKTEDDIRWVDNQIKKMECEMKRENEQLQTVEQLAFCGADTTQWNWSSDDEICKND